MKAHVRPAPERQNPYDKGDVLSEPAPFGVNVIGFVSSKLGLGSAARLSVSSLVRCGVPVAVVDIDPGEKRARADLTWQHLNINASEMERLPFPVNLVHINPVEAAPVRLRYPSWFADRFNAIVPFWELPRIPLQWIALLEQYDMILAASQHIAAAVRRDVSAPVRSYPMAVDKVDVSGATREKYGLPRDVFLFAMSFDTDSGLNRKNAIGALEAFGIAFRDRDDVGLVVKVNGVTTHPALQAASLALGARVHLLDRYLPYDEVIGLYAVCDAYVSLHRAEGLGLGVMETMLLGKPVVTTGWSGNMDFTTDQNCALVRHKLTPMVDPHAEYSQQRFHEIVSWAEPNLMEAVMMMRRIVDDAAYRERMGSSARQAIEARSGQFFGGIGVRAILDGYLSWSWRKSVGILD